MPLYIGKSVNIRSRVLFIYAPLMKPPCYGNPGELAGLHRRRNRRSAP